MAPTTAQRSSALAACVAFDQGVELWRLVGRQHGVVARRQLLAAGLSRDAIAHRLRTGRLFALWRGVYAVGRPEVGRHGRWMAAVLACGAGAALSHRSAGLLWGMLGVGPPAARAAIDVSVPSPRAPRGPGIRVHRRRWPASVSHPTSAGVPVTSPVDTLIDLATVLAPAVLERAVNEADRLDLARVDRVRAALAEARSRPGAGRLRRLLDRATFALTESELERRFVALALGAGLPAPATGVRLDGFKVDFHWPALALVVETDGLRYHRTPAQQLRDRVRDQAHTAAGRTCLRFTHGQVRYQPEHVRRTLLTVAARQRD